MSYVSLEDDFHSNPKVLSAGLDGAGLYARGLSYCGAHLTDGYLPRAWILGATEGKKGPIKKCVLAGLIAEVEGGYVIRDYLEHNPSKVQVLERRAERSESGKKGARKRWVGREKGQGQPDSSSDGSSDSSSHGDSEGSNLANGSHSAPTSSLPSEEVSTAKAVSVEESEDDPIDEHAIQRVYATWRRCFDKQRANYRTISPPRRAIIKRRLKKWSPNDLIRAMEACVAWEQPRWWLTHNDLDVVLKSDGRIEHFLELADNPPVDEDARNGSGLSSAQILALADKEAS